MALTEEVLKLVDEAVEKETFSAKAAEGITQLRMEHEAQGKKIEKLEKAAKEQEERYATQAGKLTEYKDSLAVAMRDLTEWETRRKALTERERQCSLNELETRLVREHKGDIVNLTQSIFRNTVVRERLTTPILHPPYVDQYDNHSSPWVEDRETTKETTTE